MIEKDRGGVNLPSRIETVFSDEVNTPFQTRREGNQWQLVVNKRLFQTRGFTPDEIDGATFLEQERLNKQTIIASVASVEGVRQWRDVASHDPKATSFKAVFERLSALASLEKKDPVKATQARKYLETFAARSPGEDYTDQLFGHVLKRGLGQEHPLDPGLVATVAGNLERQEKIEGREVSSMDALLSPDLSFSSKASWFEARFLPRLEFLERQEQAKKQKEVPEEVEEPQPPTESTPPSPTPPQSEDEYEQHRGREEKSEAADPLFIIDPGQSGYWETNSYDVVDETTGRQSKSPTLRIKTALSSTTQTFVDDTQRKVKGVSGINLFDLPLTPGFQMTQEGLSTLKSQGMEIFIDAEGHLNIRSPNDQSFEAQIAMTRAPLSQRVSAKDEVTTLQFPPEIDAELGRIRAVSADSLEKLQNWIEFIQTNFKYPPDDQVEAMYQAVDRSGSRLEALVNGKLLDCYLAREIFIAGIKRLSVPDLEWRAAVGHYVAGVKKDGTSHLHDGNRHAWVKIRTGKNNEWIIFDPTPPGDPIHKGEGSMDEFDQFSPEPLSEQDLEQLTKEAKTKEDKNIKKTTEDQYLLKFASDAGVPPEEARQILAELQQADQLKDREGRSIAARLDEQFNRIIETYTVQRQETAGMVEMSRGQDLEDPVSALVDIRAGNLDPLGFNKKRVIEEKEEQYGGLDLEIIGDGSGSMAQPAGGSEAKYITQRKMSYLLHRRLHRFSQKATRRQMRLTTPLKIRSSQYIFRGNKIEVVKPLTDEFTPPQMAVLWKKSAENIGGGTPAHLGLRAVLDRIPPDERQLLQDKKLLKVVALISDGGYDDSGRAQQLIDQLRALNVVVAEFNVASSTAIENLPQNVADKVIEVTGQLMPQRIKRQ